jgi:MarR family
MPSAKKAATAVAKKAAKKPAGVDAREKVFAGLKGKGGLTAGQVAEKVGLARSTVTRTLADLENDGLAERVKGGHDGKARVPDTWYQPGKKPKAGGSGKKAASPNGAAPAAPLGDRLGKGELRELVLAHLAKHPKAEFGPSQLAKPEVLGRSAGAIANALDKLAEDDKVRLTGEKPRRYRFNKR